MELTWSDVLINTRNRKSGQIKTTCPKCSHLRKKKNDPCLSVNIDEKLWKCHNCEWQGTLKIPQQKKQDYKIPEFNNTPLSDKVLAYFTKTRKISKATVLRWKITEEKKYIPQIQKERSVMCFNYFRNDQLVNVKYRDAEKNMFMVSGAEMIFYGLDLLKDSDRYNNRKEITITEGEFEPLSFYEAGIDGVLSVPNGASGKKLDYLDNCIDYFKGLEKIIIATDDDPPGLSLRNELSRRLGKERCFYVTYPEGCKDPNEVLVKHGKKKLKEVHNNPIPFPIDRTLTIGEIYGDIVDLYKNGIDKGVNAGIEGFDQHLTFKTNQLTTITGIPSHGKSLATEFIITKLMVKTGWKFAVFSPEHYPVALHLQRFYKMLIGKPFFHSRVGERMNYMEMERANDFLSDKLYFIQPGEYEITLDEILESCKGLVRRYGVNALVIDPWNEIDHNYEGLSETQYVERALRKIKRFKAVHDINVFLIAHPTKMPKNEQTGKYYVPSLYNINGSANFYNKTDNGICVYRDFDTNLTTVYVQKVKFSHLGSVGDCTWEYNPKNERFTPLGVPHDNKNWLVKEDNQFPIAEDTIQAFEEEDHEPDF